VIDADGMWLVTHQPEIIKGYEHVVLTPNAMEYRTLRDSVLGTRSVSERSGSFSSLQRTISKEDELIEDDLMSLCQHLGNITILRKGEADFVCNGRHVIKIDSDGSPKRCGGQGDILSGVIATLVAWSTRASKNSEVEENTFEPDLRLCAVAAACELVRKTSRVTFLQRKRSMLAADMLENIGPVFEDLFPNSSSL
jgi:ATP-dependent NAD(P)H-hydrate dehydratase